MNGFTVAAILNWTFLAAAPAGENGDAAVNPLATGMIVAGVVFLGMLMTYSIRSRMARRAAETPTSRERIEALKRKAEGRQDPERERAMLLDEAQRYAATLDNKARRLEMLLSEADEAITQLTDLREQVRILVERSRRKSGPAEATAASETPPSVERTPVAAVPAGEALASARRAVDALVPEIDTLVAPRDPLTASIYELADAGKSVLDIARELDEHTGKVELILALRTS